MSRKLFLEADPNQVTFKKLLGKDFLELSMRTVSSANPNRNGSWFTKEAQEKALSTYDDKPILAYFTNGDFVSHDGEWRRDPDTDMDFWDTLGTKGERPIGLIRGKDKKQVIYDEKTGLYWTEITCALWTQYSYRQVKRLIEDAIKAAKRGGPTKSISVEVDITDWEELPNGVLKINDYNLIGVTILGSRNGVTVEPGIEGAQLSVLDVMSKELYERQRHSLMHAYELLDQTLPNKEAKEVPTEETQQQPQQQDVIHQNNEGGETCPECGNNPCTCEDQHQQESTDAPKTGDEEQQSFEGKPEDKPEGGEQDPADGKKKEQESLLTEGEEEPNPKAAAICDLAWLIEGRSWNIQSYDDTIKHYEEIDDMPGKGLIIATLKRMKACAEEDLRELGELLALVTAEGFAEDASKEAFEADLASHCSLSTLYSQYLDVKAQCEAAVKECDELKGKCEAAEQECKMAKEEFEAAKAAKAELEHSMFLDRARAAVAAAADSIEEADATSIISRCESKEIFSDESLNNEIAIAIGKNVLASKNTKVAYTAPVPTMPQPPVKKAAEASKDPFVRMGYKAKK